jgi:hypothetical protein
MRSIITNAAAFIFLASIASRASQPGPLPGATSEPVTGAPGTNSLPAVGYNPAISPYVTFLRELKQSPTDYILGLFQTNDLVMLCERRHPETTQYDMIYAVVSDPRFQHDAGHVFTEIGAAALRPYIEAFLMDDQLSEKQVNERLRYIAWHLDWQAAWEKTNFYDFLKRLHYLNRTLPKERRVHLYPSDLSFDWSKATKKSWAKFDHTQGEDRDKLMAKNVIHKFDQLKQVGSRTKALVIMNYRHAFPELKAFAHHQNTGAFLMRAYPGRVANVLINTVAPEPPSGQWPIGEEPRIPVQGGKWDAAFAVLGNPNLGFDFKGSPLGEDCFDLFPYRNIDARYREVFTGFVFFKPLQEHRLSIGLPDGICDETFVAEVVRRGRITGKHFTSADVERWFGTVQISGYNSAWDYAKQIQRWLKPRQ